jgi:hypothetical protein
MIWVEKGHCGVWEFLPVSNFHFVIAALSKNERNKDQVFMKLEIFKMSVFLEQTVFHSSTRDADTKFKAIDVVKPVKRLI